MTTKPGLRDRFRVAEHQPGPARHRLLGRAARTQRPRAHASARCRSPRDAVERGEVVRTLRKRAAGQIGRRGHRHDVDRRELARDQAGGQREAAADGGVEPFAHQVDGAVVEVPVGHHARIAGEEFRQQRQQEVAAEAVAHADLEGAGRVVVEPAHPRHRPVQRGERRIDLREEALAALGEREAPGAAVKEPRAQIGLEARHVLADAGRRQAEDARRGGEAAVLGRANERDQVLQLRHDRS